VLSHAANIARAVPIYVLHVVRDLNRIEDLARLVTSWHADGASSPEWGA
jgi:hypothetical protein